MLVTYEFSWLDPRCRPQTLEFIIDATGDLLPGSTTVVAIRNAAGTVTLDVPPGLEHADVVRATTRTQAGHPSEAASVLIR